MEDRMGISDNGINLLAKKRIKDVLRHNEVAFNVSSLPTKGGQKPTGRFLGRFTGMESNRYVLTEVVTQYEDNSFTYEFYILDVGTVRIVQLDPFDHDEAQIFVQPFVVDMQLCMNEYEPESALFTIASYDDLPTSLPEVSKRNGLEGERSVQYILEERIGNNFDYTESRICKIPIQLDD